MSTQAPTLGFPFDLYRAIGDDRYVTPGELPPEAGDAGHALWEVYDRHFGRFTGAGLDPGFSRFLRAEVPFGQPRFPARTPVIVAGPGPGLAAAADDIRAARSRVLIVSGPAGAAALQHHGLSADLVILERAPGGRPDAAPEPLTLGPRTALFVDPSAPLAAFERAVVVRRLARDLPSWGIWPATAAAVALRGGATRLVTVGLDGGDVEERARADALLAMLARHGEAQCFEIASGTGRAGWWPTSWPNVVPSDAPPDPAVGWIDLGGAELLRAEAERDLHFLAPLLPHARAALSLARRARGGEAVSGRDLARAVEMLLVWGADPSIRWALQRALGLTFLPRLWRTGVSMAAPERLWRPLVLVLHELVEQADRFESRLTTLGHAGAGASGASAPASSAAADRRAPRIAEDRVSVIVPVLDDHPHLEEALASLGDQTYAELEILVVHDGARAARCEPLKALPRSNLRFLHHGGTFADALNAGLDAATGAFAICHGADDVSHPQRVARQVAYLRAHPEIGILATASGVIGGDGEAAAIEEAATWTPGAIEAQLRTGRCFEHGSVMGRRALIREAGGYQLRAGSPPDHDLWLRLLPTTKFAKLPTRLYLRRAR